MKKKGTPRLSQPRGQALVEFVLVLPLLLIIASLVIDLANFVFVAHRLSAATREGAKIATESAMPIPDPDSIPPACDMASCVGGTSLCCIAVNRTSVVLFNTGIRENVTIEGEWITRPSGPITYVLLQITASTRVNFFFWSFFGVTDRNLTFSSVGFGSSFP